MPQSRSRQGDLFETRQAAMEVRPEDRAKLLALLQTLLTEALAVAPLEGSGRNPRETRDDQDIA
jgi:hypothetical protein